LLVSTSN